MQNYKHVPELSGRLSATDFRAEGVVLAFEDGSSAKFRFAFARREADFVVVYTEHCGYHAFPAGSVVSGG